MERKTKILFVDDDPNVLSGLRRLLRSCRNKWQMQFANSGNDALKIMESDTHDVIVSDMKMPEVDGATLLTSVSKTNPETVRLVLSGQAEKSKILQIANVAHQFLSKPCDSNALQSAINDICQSQTRLGNQELRGVVTQASGVPCLPENYSELTRAFDDAEFTRVKQIISRDIGLSATVMKLVSSSFFGTPNVKCSALAACEMLGFELLSQLFYESDVFQPMESETLGEMSFTELYRHSFLVAELAAKIARSNVESREAVSASRNAGLFHDIGRLLLARHFPESFVEALNVAKQESISLDEAERSVFGSTHVEVGAYLLSLWGIDPEVIQAVCTFKDCEQLEMSTFGIQTAVFSANLLVNENSTDYPSFRLEDSQHIQRVGCVDQIPLWRSLIGSSIQ